MKNIFIYFFLIFILILSACNSKQLNPAEADRSMKILNGNLVNLLSTGSEKPEFKAISFLLNQISTPLPFVKKGSPTQPEIPFNFDEKKGEYQWNSLLKTFEKSGDSDHISLLFPAEKSDKNNIRFDLNNYQSQAFSSRPAFPIEIDAILKADDQEIATIRHTARISNNLPEQISSKVKATDYELSLELKRTQLNKVGKLLIDIDLKTKGITVIAAKVDAQIEYSRQGFFFKTINFRLKLIDHTVKGEINYAAIDPTSADYISSFNSNSSILVYEGRNLVGNVVLNKTENGELLDYFIQFQNKDEILLSQYIPMLKKLLDLKY